LGFLGRPSYGTEQIFVIALSTGFVSDVTRLLISELKLEAALVWNQARNPTRLALNKLGVRGWPIDVNHATGHDLDAEKGTEELRGVRSMGLFSS